MSALDETTRALGIDISKWDVFYDPNKKPVDFVIQRASYGMHKDEAYEKLHTPVMSIGIRGAYHYFSTAVPWKEQADFFLEVCGSDFHFLNLDIETAFNNAGYTMAQDCGKWMAYVSSRFSGRVLYYSNLNIYNTVLAPNAGWMSAYPFWYARYYWLPYQSPNKNPILPSGVNDWKIWQYSADGNNLGATFGVGARDVDIDVYNGTPEEMIEWLGIGDEPEPPPNDEALQAWQQSVDEQQAKINELRG